MKTLHTHLRCDTKPGGALSAEADALAQYRISRPSALIMVFFAGILLSSCVTPYRQLVETHIEQFCAQDGGITVYETVQLPPGKKMFTYEGYLEKKSARGITNKSRHRLIRLDMFNPALRSEALGPEYIWAYSPLILQRKEPGSPRVWRLHYLIARRADKKILGELISYRAEHDGTIQPLGQMFFGGTYINGCPEGLGPESLISAVFAESVKPKK